MGPRRFVVLLAVAILLLAGAPTALHATSVRTMSPSTPSPGLTTDAMPLSSSGVATDVPGAQLVRLTLTLEPSNASELATFLYDVENPLSPEFRSFLTAPEFEREFAPRRSAIDTVEQTLANAGARAIALAPGDAAVGALVSAAAVHRLLGVTLVGVPGGPDQLTYSAVGALRLAAGLRSEVVGVGGLSDVGNAGLTLAAASSQYVLSNASGVQWAVGSDFARAYQATALWPGSTQVVDPTYPTHVAIATLLAGGYDKDNSTNLPPYDPAVVDQYFHDTLDPAWPVSNVTGVPVTLPGGTAPPLPGSFHGVNDSTGDETENSLDLEMAGSLAPGASLYNFYFPGSALDGGGPLGDLADDLADDLGAALNYNYSPAALAVVSVSAGLPDLNDSLWNEYLAEAAATGVTIVAASGDEGDYPGFLSGGGDGQWPVWPSTAAFNDSGAISAGGVSLNVSGAPTSVFDGSAINATYDDSVDRVVNQSVWFDRSLGAGSEGGASLVLSEPWWQFHSAAQPAIVNATVLEGASALGRAVPDLAFPANNTIVYDYANATGVVYAQVLEGTSIAAPVLAGLLADVVAVRSAQAGNFSPLGFIDPELYRIASYYARYPGSADPFMDVTQGSNFVFSALPGWDAATGWGGLNVSLFLAADANATVRDYAYTGPTPTLPPRTSPDRLSVVELALIVGIAASASVLVAVAVRGWRGRRATVRSPVAGPPSSAPPGASGTATFACPFCGAPRPAEPVRCGHCGAY